MISGNYSWFIFQLIKYLMLIYCDYIYLIFIFSTIVKKSRDKFYIKYFSYISKGLFIFKTRKYKCLYIIIILFQYK